MKNQTGEGSHQPRVENGVRQREKMDGRVCNLEKTPRVAAFVESHPSQSARRMGHPLCCFCRRDQEPGRTPVQVGAACRLKWLGISCVKTITRAVVKSSFYSLASCSCRAVSLSRSNQIRILLGCPMPRNRARPSPRASSRAGPTSTARTGRRRPLHRPRLRPLLLLLLLLPAEGFHRRWIRLRFLTPIGLTAVRL